MVDYYRRNMSRTHRELFARHRRMVELEEI